MLDICTDIKEEHIGKSIFKVCYNSYIIEYKIIDTQINNLYKNNPSIDILLQVVNGNNPSKYNSNDKYYTHKYNPPKDMYWNKKDAEDTIEEYKNALREKIKNPVSLIRFIYDKTIKQIDSLSPYDIIDCIDLNGSEINIIEEKIKEYFQIDIEKNKEE